jgi:murein DD-endopeptidase MepM/ murein hydrolase activator NlpD
MWIPFAVLAGICAVLTQPSRAVPLAPVAAGAYMQPAPAAPCTPRTLYEELREQAMRSGAVRGAGTEAATYPQYIWPMEKPLHNGNVTANYVDDNPAYGVITDYNDGTIAYDGHNGTDIGILDFRAMDKGFKVIAGAAGTVIQTSYIYGDRNIGPPFLDNGNFVFVQNAGGSQTWYFHMRRYSLTVDQGEVIVPGQMLGYAGSSGYSYGPHLHFEAGEYDSLGYWRPRDPWRGSYQPLPSLWISQEPYVGTTPMHVYDIGVTTQQASGGDVFNIPWNYFLDRLTQPAVMGANEPYLVVWFQMQAPVGATYTVEVRRPDNSLFGSYNYTFTAFATGAHVWVWNFAGYVPPSAYGTWTARVLIGGVTARAVQFPVNANTVYGPRFFPVAGRSFRIHGVTQFDTLRVSSLDPSVTYSLLSPPSFVSLRDSIVTIGATSNQPSRSLYFQAIATDTQGRRDTMWYHLVDPSKPVEQALAVGETPVSEGKVLLSVRSYPNPVREEAAIGFTLSGAVRARLQIFDTGGHAIATLLNGVLAEGAHLAHWNARDVPRGVYWYRLRAGVAEKSGRLVVAR